MPARSFLSVVCRRLVLASMYLFCTLGFPFPSVAQDLPPRKYGVEYGMPAIQNYNPKSWERLTPFTDAWCIAQDREGRMVIGSSGGVLRYNGAAWELAETPGRTNIRALAQDATGRVYAGGENDLGYLAPDATGKMRFVSLLHQLPADKREFGLVLSVIATPEGVYFGSDEYLFRWHQGRFRTWKARTAFGLAFWVNQKLYVPQPGYGLTVLQQDELRVVARDSVLAKSKIQVMLPAAGGGLFIGTRQQGLFAWKDNRLTAVRGETHDLLTQRNSIYRGIALPDGTVALATLQKGVLLVDQQGRLKRVFNKGNGLASNTIYNLGTDDRGGLWITHNAGVSRVELTSPFSVYQDRNGLSGSVRAICRHQGRIHAATADGLFVLDPPDAPGKLPAFRWLPDYPGGAWDLLSHGEALFISGTEGVHVLEKGRLTRLYAETAIEIQPSTQHPDVVFFLSQGLHAVRRNGRAWRYAGKANVRPGPHTLIQNSNGDIWLPSSRNGVYHVRMPAMRDPANISTLLQQAAVRHYGPEQGLPNDHCQVFLIGNQIVLRFGSDDRFTLYVYDERKDVFRTDPDFTRRYGFGAGRAWPEFEYNDPDAFWVWHQSPGTAKPVFTRVIRGPGSKFTHQPYRFDGYEDFTTVANTFRDRDGVIWMGNRGGLLRFDPGIALPGHKPFRTLLTRLWMPPDSSLYSLRAVAQVTLPFALPLVRFEFSAPSYRLEQETTFQSMLEGYDDQWSAWSKEPFRAYTRIPEGRYTMRVRAKTIDGILGEEATYTFKVLPPWYRTWPLYGVYLLLAGGVVYGLIHWRSRQLEAEKQELEAVVAQRTTQIARTNAQLAETNEKLAQQSAEVAAKNTQLQTQAQLLAAQAEALAAQTQWLRELDDVKSRFFANISHEFRTPLTLILGNLQDKLASVSSAAADAVPVPARELAVMQRNAGRLLELINQLLDLSKLESGQLHLAPRPAELTGFLRVLAASFTSLADARRIQFRVLLPGEPLYLHFDADKLEKIIYNLLANAFKFTPDAGTVTLHAEKLPAGNPADGGPLCLLRLAVHNGGPGIPADQLGKVFDRFFQGSRHYADGQGTGIGLALVKELVQLHGGRVHAESDDVRGTRFVVELPLPEAAPGEVREAGATAPPAATGPLPAADGTVPVPAAAEGALSGERPAERAELPLLLVVEDNADLRGYIRGHLEGAFRVLESENGRLGLEAARQHMPDLVISDLMMPDVDGLELCAQLKTDERTSHIPVILLTALAAPDDKLKGLETGADDYLTKPFDARELTTRVSNLIGLRHRLRERFSREIRVQPRDIAVTSTDEKFLDRAMQVVEAHLGDPDFGPEQFSREMNVSRMQLHRKLTALTGQATGDFLRLMRLKRAAQLLRARAGNVSEVSYQTGFQNLPHFSKVFKEQFGMTPSEYAAQGEVEG